MGFFTISALICVLGAAYRSRQTGLHGVDVGGHIVHQDPEKWQEILLRNIIIFLGLYVPIYLILYKSPLSSYFLPYKLNKNYPSIRLVTVEAGRSAREGPQPHQKRVPSVLR